MTRDEQAAAASLWRLNRTVTEDHEGHEETEKSHARPQKLRGTVVKEGAANQSREAVKRL